MGVHRTIRRSVSPTAIQLENCQVLCPEGASLNDDLLSELLVATEAGIEVELYLAGRRAGISHEQLIKVHHDQFVDILYLVKAHKAKVRYEEVLLAARAGLGPGDYLALREAGIDHQSALAAARSSAGPEDYLLCRRAGGSHKRILRAHSSGVNLFDYATALAQGTTHSEILAAYLRRMDLTLYNLARQAGATHREVCRAKAARIPLHVYARARLTGTTHREVFALGKHKGELGNYAAARRAGATHTELMEVLTVGVRCCGYGGVATVMRTYLWGLRQDGLAHEKALAAALPATVS